MNLSNNIIDDFIKYTIDKLYKKRKYESLVKIEREVCEFYSIFYDSESQNLIRKFKNIIPTSLENEQLDKRYIRRLGKELYLIRDKGFYKVFNQVYDILDLTRDMVHVIRGSCGSSLTCYLLGITHIDPIKNDICLARFMHILRDDIPDIDIDFPTHLRDEVYRRIFQKYPGRVARISNHVHYGHNTALKQAMKNNGITGFIPKEFNLMRIIRKRVNMDSELEYMELSEKIVRDAKILNGTEKHTSLHCGGIFITDGAVPADLIYKEIDLDGIKAYQVSLDKDETEAAGFIKIDVLSNRGLSLLTDVYSELKNQDIHLDSFEKLPLEERVFDSLTVNNMGIVYAESRGIYQLFRRIRPKTINDISICLALIRPAASANGQKSAYLNLSATERVDIPWVIYDDDAIVYIQELLDIDDSDADIYRRAFAKGNSKIIREFKHRLLIKRDMTSAKVQEICDKLDSLREYSFCKSHAMSYAYLVYALAYLKFHYPREFWKAALNYCQSSYRDWVHYREAIRHIPIVNERGPYGFNVDRTSLISINNSSIQTRLFTDNKSDYLKNGFWTGRKFLEGMYYYIRDDGEKKRAYFCGLIATYRFYRDEGAKITFVTLGYDNGYYIDLIIDKIMSLSKTHFIKGNGILTSNGYISVKSIEPCKL
jgi:DNA polymerase III alpha subunit